MATLLHYLIKPVGHIYLRENAILCETDTVGVFNDDKRKRHNEAFFIFFNNKSNMLMIKESVTMKHFLFSLIK